MTDEIERMRERAEGTPDILIGPFEVWHVVIDGRRIPRLTGYHEGDKIALIVDGRFSHSFSHEDALPAAWLLANALAIGEGYSHVSALNKDRPFAPLSMGIETAGKKTP